MKIKKTILLIMDGVAERNDVFGNAVKQAKTPNLDFLKKTYPNILLNASGESVGLPNGQMGNSEVGHLNIGAGRVVYTGLSLINKEIRDGLFEKNEAFTKAINHTKKSGSKLHIMGLLSRGGVHSSFEHIVNLVQLANNSNVDVVVHCFADGRDVDQKAFANDISEFIQIVNVTSARIGCIAGRYYAMDRDQRWDRIEKVYNTLVGNGNKFFSNASAYVQDSYNNEIYDEFIEPAMNSDVELDEIKICDNDAVIFGNFRPDRARELSYCIKQSGLYEFKPKTILNNVFLVTMCNYEGIKADAVAYPALQPVNVLGEVIQNSGLKQLRIAETEKYAHVTFFFDGGIDINYSNEEKILIPSPKVTTYDQVPEMSALEITKNLVNKMNKFDFIVVNYANGDMVGHTGNFQATVKAVEVVDEQIGIIYKAALKNGFTLVVTADHGNADEMITAENEPITKHSTNLVPFILTDKKISFDTNEVYSLSNIAPTLLTYMGVEVPNEMTAKSILKKNK